MVSNTPTSYGSLARLFHWLIATLILIDIGLGLYGESVPRNASTVETLKTVYSVHKTIGVSVLGLAVLRIIWALVQPRPAPLHPERKAETLLAETIHWALYGAIVIMPLSGWIMHASESGFAPILWPFGQGLPFVPKSEDVAHAAGAVHGLAAWVIYATVALHVAGALKHALVDRDSTLARMVSGKAAGQAGAHRAPFAAVAGVAVWAIVLGAALIPRLSGEPSVAEARASSTATSQTAWAVDEGTLAITVQQMGAAVTGSFARWDAQIDYAPDAGTGSVTVVIDTTSLTLGSVTEQAKGAEFFDTSTYPQAVFEGPISRDADGQHVVDGQLTLVGQSAPVRLVFTLDTDGNTASMSGDATLDRRDYGMGAGYADESTVGFSVSATVELTATRQTNTGS